MGHVHLSKMKFRHPVPDAFTPRKFNGNDQHGLEMDGSTCMPADFQVIFLSFSVPATFVVSVNIFLLIALLHTFE